MIAPAIIERQARVAGRIHCLARIVEMFARAAADEPAFVADGLPAIAVTMELMAEMSADLQEALTPPPGGHR